MIRIILLSIFLCAIFLVGYSQDQTYKRVQVQYSPEVLKSISKFGIPVENITDDNWIVLEIQAFELQLLSKAGISYEVLIDDLEKFYSERNLGKDPKEITKQFKTLKSYPVPEGFSLGSMGGFCTYDEILQNLDVMAATYPNLITQKQTISSQLTVEGHPLYWVRISDNPGTDEDEPEVLYTGLAHAREPGSMQILLFYMYYLLENYETDPEIHTLVDNTEMYFVLCMNPDGYVYNQTTNPSGGGLWRKNRTNNSDGSYGVDLNRNFGYQWAYDNYGSSSVPSSITYHGTAAFSEAETQMMKTFCNQHEFRLALNYHTYGNYLLHPWGYTASPLSPDHSYFQAIGKLMTSENNFRVGIPVSIIYLVNGESNDWMYGEQTSKPKCFALTPESGGDTDGFWPIMERIIPQCIENMHQNIMAAKLAGIYFLLNDLNPFNIYKHNGFLKYQVKRSGLTDAPFTMSIQGLSDHFVSLGPAKTYAGLSLDQNATDSISYVLGPGILPGEKIKFVLKIGSGYFSKTDTITKTFGDAELLFSDPCSTMDSWESAKWNITAESYVSPSSSITDSPSTSYTNSENSSISMKTAVNLGGAVSAWLTFNAKWIMDGGCDYVKCEASTNSGQTWTYLNGKYTKVPHVQGLPAVPVYIGNQSEWVNECIDLTAYCGNSVLIKFTIKTDAATRKDGFYFDDLEIEKISGTPQSQDYEFPAGWSSISSYLIPQNSSFNSIFGINPSQVVIIEDGTNNFYQPGNPASTLSHWDSQSGYIIKLAQNTTFEINGFIENYTQLSLNQGWHLVPVISQNPVLISEMLVTPPGSVEVIKEAAGIHTWWPEMGSSNLNTLIPGKSYFIKLKNNAVLEFPQSQ